METKLTLNINKDVARRVKGYVKKEGRSLFDLVQKYLRILTKNSSVEESDFNPGVRSLLGRINLPEHFDYKNEIADYATKKYQWNDLFVP